MFFFILSLGIDKEIKLENMLNENWNLLLYFNKGGTTKLPKKIQTVHHLFSILILNFFLNKKMLGAFVLRSRQTHPVYTRTHACVHVCVGTSI